jgi:hypothetical protein
MGLQRHNFAKIPSNKCLKWPLTVHFCTHVAVHFCTNDSLFDPTMTGDCQKRRRNSGIG